MWNFDKDPDNNYEHVIRTRNSVLLEWEVSFLQTGIKPEFKDRDALHKACLSIEKSGAQEAKTSSPAEYGIKFKVSIIWLAVIEQLANQLHALLLRHSQIVIKAGIMQDKAAKEEYDKIVKCLGKIHALSQGLADAVIKDIAANILKTDESKTALFCYLRAINKHNAMCAPFGLKQILSLTTDDEQLNKAKRWLGYK